VARSKGTQSGIRARITANRAHITLIRLSQGGKADSCALTTPQKFQPASEFFNRIGQKQSFDQLVRAQQHRRRDREPERFRSLEIDDELELRRALDRQVGRLRAVPYLVYVCRRATESGMFGP
jgi:hypothetical protein